MCALWMTGPAVLGVSRIADRAWPHCAVRRAWVIVILSDGLSTNLFGQELGLVHSMRRLFCIDKVSVLSRCVPFSAEESSCHVHGETVSKMCSLLFAI